MDDDTTARFDDFYRDRCVLVTGGAGFIGSHLADALVERGARVRVIDDLSNGRMSNIAHHVDDELPFYEASVLDDDALARAMEGVSIVFHEAALGSVPQSVEAPVHYHEVNSTGTIRVLEAARAAGAQRVVYASSSSVYGSSEALPKRESTIPSPVSPYAASKLMGEYWIQAYAQCYGLSGVSLRYFNVFGARQRPDSQYAAVVPAFISAIRRGVRPTIYGDGMQSRDFTHVSNIVHANLLAGATDAPLAGEVLNIACGERFTLLELLESIGRIMKREVLFQFKPVRAGDVRHSQASINRACEVLGYRTLVDFETGLRRTIVDEQPAQQSS